MEVVGSWPGPMQLFDSGYSLFNPDLYRYTGPDGQVFVVDKTAGLKSLTDRAGNVLTMTPAGITSSHPQVPGSTLGIAFVRDAEGRITRITDPSGKSLVYAYDANGDLQSVTDREDARDDASATSRSRRITSRRSTTRSAAGRSATSTTRAAG